MSRLRTICWVLPLLSFGICAGAQDNSQPQGTTPAPAFGQNAPVLNPDNPPLSGLDEPSLEMKTASRSFISPALMVSQSADTNANNQLNVSDVRPVTHVLGAFDLQKFWPKSDLFVEYLGGGAFNEAPYEARQLEAMGLEGVTRWRTGMVKLRDAFRYLPDGSFEIGTGGVPGLGIALGGMGTGGVGGGLPGLRPSGGFEVGTTPRLSNTAVLDVIQAISPRSALTVAGGFSSAHFFDNTAQLINSDQTTIEGGYSHMISRRDQLAGVYGFQLFRFPYASGGEIYNHVLNVRWSHTISGRMSLIVGAGPQYSDIRFFGTSSTRWSPSGRAVLHYKFEHASLAASFEKFISEGSGIFGGADTEVARLAYQRPLGRTTTLLVDLGYAHKKRLSSFGAPGVNATSYDEGYAGFMVRKHLGRTYDVFAAYHFNEVDFNLPNDISGTSGKINQRHRGTIGLEWHPKPTRIE